MSRKSTQVASPLLPRTSVCDAWFAHTGVGFFFFDVRFRFFNG